MMDVLFTVSFVINVVSLKSRRVQFALFTMFITVQLFYTNKIGCRRLLRFYFRKKGVYPGRVFVPGCCCPEGLCPLFFYVWGMSDKAHVCLIVPARH